MSYFNAYSQAGGLPHLVGCKPILTNRSSALRGVHTVLYHRLHLHERISPRTCESCRKGIVRPPGPHSCGCPIPQSGPDHRDDMQCRPNSGRYCFIPYREDYEVAWETGLVERMAGIKAFSTYPPSVRDLPLDLSVQIVHPLAAGVRSAIQTPRVNVVVVHGGVFAIFRHPCSRSPPPS